MTVAVVHVVPGASIPPGQHARFLTEPGLGAIVLDGGRTVLVHQRLLNWVPWVDGGDPAVWLASLTQRLLAKGYRVEDREGNAFRVDVAPAPTRARAKALARRALRVPARQRMASVRRRWRRRAFLVRLRWEAWLSGTRLTVDVAKDLRVEPGVRFELRPGPVVVRIGPRTTIASGVLFRLGGDLLIGPNCELRHNIVINVKGSLELEGRVGLGVGVMIHADLPLVFEWGAMAAEYATVLDSHHEFDGTMVYTFDKPVTARQVRIGACCFLGSKSSVMPGVTVGRRSVVGAGSVVTKDVSEGWVVTGAPARPVRELPNPERD